MTGNLAFFMPYQRIYADAVASKTDAPAYYRAHGNKLQSMMYPKGKSNP